MSASILMPRSCRCHATPLPDFRRRHYAYASMLLHAGSHEIVFFFIAADATLLLSLISLRFALR